MEKILVLEKLEASIVACEQALKESTRYDVDFSQVIALARKIAPATIPPQGLRYAPEQGPLEALPARFRLPFPSQDEMRLSSVFILGNKATTPQTPPVQLQAPTAPAPQPLIIDEDEFAQDF
jgi:hypothetical protein